MSFSKAKLKRFNDIDVASCVSPATTKLTTGSGDTLNTAATMATPTTSAAAAATTTPSSSSTGHPERKEQIEKFFKDAVRFASNSKDTKEFAIPKENKEDKKSKGLRLFRTPSLPHRLRFRQNSDATATAAHNNNNNNSNNNNNGGAAAAAATTASSTPLNSAATTPVKEVAPKSGSRLKGKEALQQEIRKKNELIENYASQIDVLKRHVDQMRETEAKLRDENKSITLKAEQVINALTAENRSQKEVNAQLSVENEKLLEKCSRLGDELKAITIQHAAEIVDLNAHAAELKANNIQLAEESQKQNAENIKLQEKCTQLAADVQQAYEKLADDEEKAQKNYELIQNLRNTKDALIIDVAQLKKQIEQDALAYGQETKVVHNEMECLKHERNTLKNDLASKCELIRSLQEELLDKNCEIDAHCDTIRQMCREKANYVERERLMEAAEEKIRMAETQAEMKVQKCETDLEKAIEREKSYWRGELSKRQKMAENEMIKIELEKQDVMVLLETTNDMLRERDEKIQKYEEQLSHGINYYIQLTDTLQKQIVNLKQDMAKTISEKYNYQLTLNNTRSTVNILMERLKKSDDDVEQLKAELESVQLAKGALEHTYLTLQADMEALRAQHTTTESALKQLCDSSQQLQNEVSIKENIYNDILTSEEATLMKFNKIASSFQERIDTDVNMYLDLYNELKNKDETREMYIQDMKKALDDFANVLQYAQLELDSKEKTLAKVREECEQLKFENISLKSKIEESAEAGNKKENSTDLEKIEDLLIDSELRAECDKITSWLLSSAEKSVHAECSNEMGELLKAASTATPTATAVTTPNSKSRNCTTPVRSSGGKIIASIAPHTPRTPRTPKSTHTPRTTPKKTVLFMGKENIPLSPQKQVLKARNV